MRGVRFLMEYAKAEEALRAWGVRSTIVVFGSARAGEKGPAHHAAWYRQARAFGRIVSERGGALSSNGGLRDNVIATGGGPGLMEAANRGAIEADGCSIGFNIELPFEQKPNPYLSEVLNFNHFLVRKAMLRWEASALIALPGGFGT